MIRSLIFWVWFVSFRIAEYISDTYGDTYEICILHEPARQAIWWNRREFENDAMIAKGSGYVRGNRQAATARLTSHFKYIEHRSRELSLESRDDRRIFTKQNDVVNRRDAVNEVMEHTSTSVNYHKIVLSPSEEEPVHDWREWTRQVMHDLEEAQGKELHWFAVQHHNTEHPHVHVVVAGAGYNQEKDREEPVKLYTSDYDLLRQAGREHSDYHFHRLLEEQFQELDTRDRTVDREFEAPQPEREPFRPSLEDFDR